MWNAKTQPALRKKKHPHVVVQAKTRIHLAINGLDRPLKCTDNILKCKKWCVGFQSPTHNEKPVCYIKISTKTSTWRISLVFFLPCFWERSSACIYGASYLAKNTVLTSASQHFSTETTEICFRISKENLGTTDVKKAHTKRIYFIK